MTNKPSENPTSDASHALLVAAVARLAPRARALIIVGLVIVLLGVALMIVITQSRVTSLIAPGLLMSVAGLLELGIGHNARGDDARSTPWALAAVFNIVAGLTVVAAPFLPIPWLSGLTGIYLIAAGVIRLRSDFALPLARRSAVMRLSAIVTTLIGLLILTRWPGSNLVLLGALLGVEMIARGWAWVGFGVTLRRALTRSGTAAIS